MNVSHIRNIVRSRSQLRLQVVQRVIIITNRLLRHHFFRSWWRFGRHRANFLEVLVMVDPDPQIVQISSNIIPLKIVHLLHELSYLISDFCQLLFVQISRRALRPSIIDWFVYFELSDIFKHHFDYLLILGRLVTIFIKIHNEFTLVILTDFFNIDKERLDALVRIRDLFVTVY